ncbi:MAG: hypothetical protein AB7V50_04230 [Vampirovibrionia bacterium]
MNNFIKHLTVFVSVVVALFVINTAVFAQSCSFSGTWNTNFGKMTLSQSGSSVKGTLGSEKITGSVQGYMLQGSYWGTSYPADVTFYMSPDCKQINGEYYSGSTKKDWHGTRISGGSSSSSQSGEIRVGGYGLPTQTQKPAPPTYNWNGTWSTTSGNLRLTKTKSGTLEGTYTQHHPRKGYIQGYIKGTIKGNTASCNWSEGPTYKAPNDAGQVVFTMAKGSNSFTGQWRFGYNEHYNNWKNGWDGTRTGY